jgi:hypothetical protein
MSFPQRFYAPDHDPSIDYRTPAELARFRSGLTHLNFFYGHPLTMTVIADTPLPAAAENPTPIERRGSSAGREPTN